MNYASDHTFRLLKVTSVGLLSEAANTPICPAIGVGLDTLFTVDADVDVGVVVSAEVGLDVGVGVELDVGVGVVLDVGVLEVVFAGIRARNMLPLYKSIFLPCTMTVKVMGLF